MKIAVASDHAGFKGKEIVEETLREIGIEYEDFGTNSSEESVDYPDFARIVGEKIGSGEFAEGILVCGSGTGMAIAANKVHGIRAAVGWNEETARLARLHNNANILTIGERTTPEGTIPAIVKAWFEAKFEGGRHARRVEKISAIENSKGN